MAKDTDGIRILIVTGSARPGNYTAMASALVAAELAKRVDVTTEVIDPAKLDLPIPGTHEGEHPGAHALRESVTRATGVILVTPEYHGSFSALMKLTIENLGFPSVLAGKPVTLLGVAAGSIGAIKSLEHLRSVCSHVGAVVLPTLISVANVQQVFDPKGNCLDAKFEKLVRGVGTSLIDFIHSSVCPRITLEKLLREKPVVTDSVFPVI